MSSLLDLYIAELLRLRAMTPVPRSEEGKSMCSPLFLVRKASGKWRPDLDLKNLSSFLKQQLFHMEFLKIITAVIQRNDWMISIDLENAYFHIPVAKNHQHYLRFHFKGSHFEFRCLPFWPLFSPKNLFKSSSNSC